MTNQEITDLMIWEFYRKKFPYDEMTIRMANERIFYYSIEYLRKNNFLLAEINSITNVNKGISYSLANLKLIIENVKKLFTERYLFEDHTSFIFVFSSFIEHFSPPWADPKK